MITFRAVVLCFAGLVCSQAMEIGLSPSYEERSNEQRSDLGDFQCPSSGRFANPKSCDSYIECYLTPVMTEKLFVFCPPDQHYNSETQECDDPCNAKCDQDLACSCGWHDCGFQCPTEDGKFSDLYDCSIFHECVGGNSTMHVCRPGELFDHRTAECVSEEKALCVFTCEELDYAYAHPQDVKSYILCRHGRPTVNRCESGTLFHQESNKCVISYLETNDISHLILINDDNWTK